MDTKLTVLGWTTEMPTACFCVSCVGSSEEAARLAGASSAEPIRDVAFGLPEVDVQCDLCGKVIVAKRA